MFVHKHCEQRVSVHHLVCGGGVGLRGMLHRLDCVSRLPVKIIEPPFVTVTFEAVNDTEYPLS
jgi:hypothetical protein